MITDERGGGDNEMEKQIKKPDVGPEVGPNGEGNNAENTNGTGNDTSENENSIEDELDELNGLIEQMNEKYNLKLKIRDENVDPDRERSKPKGKLDSTVKKNTAYVKKLSTLKEAQKEAFEKELAGLNLSRYIAEAAGAISDGKYKSNDTGAVVSIATRIHQRYEDFSESLYNSFKKKFAIQKTTDDPSRLKIDLKLITDLTVSAVFSDKCGLGLIHHELKALLDLDKSDHLHGSLILSIIKTIGEDVIGIIPPRIRHLAQKHKSQIPTISVIDAKKRVHFENLVFEYFESLNGHLKSEFDILKKMEKTNRHIYQQRGELHEERRISLLEQQEKMEELKKIAEQMAEMIGKEIVELPKDTEEEHQMSIDIYHPERGIESIMEECWEDDDQRLFYTSLPDLKSLVPMVAWKDSEKVRGGKFDPKRKKCGKKGPKDKGERKLENDIQEAIQDGLDELDEFDEEEEPEEIPEEAETKDGLSAKEEFDVYVKSLMGIYNRELVDQASQEFLMTLNTPINRKKLSRELWKVDRRRIDLLPFFTRLAASLKECAPQVADELAQYLIKDFRYHLRKKDQIHNEVKIKNSRYIGEAAKFELISRQEATTCFRILLLDFSIGAIEMICGLLESAGRFLLRSPDSHQKTKLLLDQLKKKKAAKSLDPRLNAQLDNAIYCCNPPTDVTREIIKRPVIHEYIRHLLYGQLSKKNTENILRQIRKLNWEDPQIHSYLVKCLSRGYNIKYSVIHCAASVLSGLSRYHEEATIEVVDNILEDIRSGMEFPDPRLNQRRIAQVRYLGELYNYRMIDSGVIFSTLYSFITFGVSSDPLTIISPLDPPENLIRLRLAAVLLDTCGCFFDRGSSKRKLDVFIQYYLRYWLWKREIYFLHNQEFPLGMDHLVRDSVESIRPRLKIPVTLEECLASVEKIETEAIQKLESLGINNEDDGMENEDGLRAIAEEEESADESDTVTDTDTLTENEHESSTKPNMMECEEDDEFVKEFESLVKTEDSVSASGGKNSDLTVPIGLKKQIENDKQEGKVLFALVTRKGTKTNVQALHVPEDSRLALGLEAAEKERVKAKEEMARLTLNMAAQQEMEEVQAEILGKMTSPTQNRNHERAKKYSHPKAPPNADALFTVGGRRR